MVVIAAEVMISGPFADEAERRVVAALAHTVPGIVEVDLRPTAAAT